MAVWNTALPLSGIYLYKLQAKMFYKYKLPLTVVTFLFPIAVHHSHEVMLPDWHDVHPGSDALIHDSQLEHYFNSTLRTWHCSSRKWPLLLHGRDCISRLCQCYLKPVSLPLMAGLQFFSALAKNLFILSLGAHINMQTEGDCMLTYKYFNLKIYLCIFSG